MMNGEFGLLLTIQETEKAFLLYPELKPLCEENLTLERQRQLISLPEKRQLELLTGGLLLELAELFQAMLLQQKAVKGAVDIPVGEHKFVLYRIELMLFLEEYLKAIACRHTPIGSRIIVNQYGKPYIKGTPFYYSISHSGEYCGIVVSDIEIGLDLQKKQASVSQHKQQHLVHRFFSEEESYLYEQVNAVSEKHGENLFWKLWCEKEAYGKALGRGAAKILGKPLAEIHEAEFIADELDEMLVIAICKLRKDWRQ